MVELESTVWSAPLQGYSYIHIWAVILKETLPYKLCSCWLHIPCYIFTGNCNFECIVLFMQMYLSVVYTDLLTVVLISSIGCMMSCVILMYHRFPTSFLLAISLWIFVSQTGLCMTNYSVIPHVLCYSRLSLNSLTLVTQVLHMHVSYWPCFLYQTLIPCSTSLP